MLKRFTEVLILRLTFFHKSEAKKIYVFPFTKLVTNLDLSYKLKLLSLSLISGLNLLLRTTGILNRLYLFYHTL